MSKKTHNLVAVGIWSFISVFLVLVLVAGIKKGEDFFRESSGNKAVLGFINVSTNINPDRSRLYDVDESLYYNVSSVDCIDIALVSEDINIETVPFGEEITVRLEGNWGDYCPTVKLRNDTLKVLRFKNINYNGLCGTVTISVPEKLLDKVNIDIVSGKINLQGITCKKMEIEKVSGSLRVENSAANFIIIENVSGSIYLDGKINGICINSVSGSIRVNSTEAFKKNSEVRSISGSIHLNIPEDEGFSVGYKNVSGSVHWGDSLIREGKNHLGTIRTRNRGVNIGVSSVSGSINVNY